MEKKFYVRAGIRVPKGEGNMKPVRKNELMEIEGEIETHNTSENIHKALKKLYPKGGVVVTGWSIMNAQCPECDTIHHVEKDEVKLVMVNEKGLIKALCVSCIG